MSEARETQKSKLLFFCGGRVDALLHLHKRGYESDFLYIFSWFPSWGKTGFTFFLKFFFSFPLKGESGTRRPTSMKIKVTEEDEDEKLCRPVDLTVLEIFCFNVLLLSNGSHRPFARQCKCRSREIEALWNYHATTRLP